MLEARTAPTEVSLSPSGFGALWGHLPHGRVTPTLRMMSWRVFSHAGRCGYLILAALSISSHIRHRAAAMYATERIPPQAQSMLLKCYTNSLPPSEPS
jgi:hypothetical protein